ncbi:MAG: GatB/YqeY domain-containing protein [Candidatus Omnitrophota bacterium]
MSLAERIEKDLVAAMKAKDEARVGTLRFLKAALKNYGIEKRNKELKDEDVIQVLRRQIKQRQDSIEAYKAGNRPELAQKEESELVILKNYMPEELSEDELKKIISQTVSEIQASGIKDMGKVMGAVMPKVAGKADGKMLSRLVSEELKKIG